MQTIDSVKRPASAPPHPRQQSMSDVTRPRPIVRRQDQLATDRPQTGARFTKLPSQKRRRHVPWAVIISVLASPLMLLMAKTGTIGMAIMAAGVVAALVVKLSSRLIFTVALMGLIYTIALQFSGSVKLAQSIAAYVYILFVGGAIALAFEVRRDSKLWFKKHH